jgi:centromeric protein E
MDGGRIRRLEEVAAAGAGAGVGRVGSWLALLVVLGCSRQMSEVDAIRVGIRARPFGKQAGQKRPWNTNDRSLQCTSEKTSKQGQKTSKQGKQLDFDHVWDEEVPQGTHTIHSEFTRPVVDSVMNGYHGTVAMYGQTGSGKTYTMFGDKKAGVPGLVDLCVEQLFETIAQQTDKDFMVRVAYIEIYNETVRDLLNPSARALKVRHSA